MNILTFSIIIPLYNKRKYIGQTIKSILGQTYKDFEVIVIDDGSSDNSASIVEKHGDPRIRLIRQKNSGVACARNRGVKEAKGRYLAFLDADDVYTSDYLMTQLLMIRSFPAEKFFATNFSPANEDVFLAEETLPVTFAFHGAERIQNYFETLYAGHLFFTSSIVICRKTFIEGAYWFPDGESMGEDQDVWMRLAESYDIIYCRRQLVTYRLGTDGSLTSSNKVLRELPFITRLALRLLNPNYPLVHRKYARKIIAKHLVDVAWNNLTIGHKAVAWNYITDRRILAEKGRAFVLLMIMCLPYCVFPHIRSLLRKCRAVIVPSGKLV